MHFLLVAGFILLILLLSIMVGKNNKLFADKFLILYLSFVFVQQLFTYAEYTGWTLDGYWILFGKGMYLLHGPFLYLYIAALTRQRHLPLTHYALLFGPFVIYVLHFLYYYLFVFDSVRITTQNGVLYLNDSIALSWLFFVALFLVSDPVYLILSYVRLREYKRRMLASVSDTDRINLNWLNLILLLWLVAALVLVPVGFLTLSLGWFTTDSLDMMIALTSVVFFFTLGFYGFKQTTVFTNLELKETGKATAANYERSGLTPRQAKDHHASLLQLMEEKKPHLNGDLTAGELSQLLGVSTNHLSQILNKEQGQNFFDFVNGYRVNEVIYKMGDPANAHLTLLAIALDSGFNSKTSFNTVFKKITGLTPSQYQKRGSNR